MARYTLEAATLWAPVCIPPAKWTRRARRRARGQSRGRSKAVAVGNVYLDEPAEDVCPRLVLPRVRSFHDGEVSGHPVEGAISISLKHSKGMSPEAVRDLLGAVRYRDDV